MRDRSKNYQRPEKSAAVLVHDYFPKLWFDFKLRCMEQRKPVYLALSEAIGEWMAKGKNSQN
jgi:hypothetical protein